MGRQIGDSTMVGSSSIALLQERFRQLQRVKEKREEKELLKLFSEAERIKPTKCLEPSKSSLPIRSPFHDSSLTLGLNSQSRHHADFKGIKTGAALTSLWSSNDAAAIVSTPKKKFENSDVDTSLHL